MGLDYSMNVPQFTRVLALFISATAAFYLYLDFEYLFYSITNPGAWDFYLAVTVIWYIYTFRTVYALLKLQTMGWYLANGWLLYAFCTRITNILSWKLIYDTEPVDGVSRMLAFAGFYAIAWWFFNKEEFKKFFDTEISNRNLSTWLPIAIAGVLFAYTALTSP